MRANLPGRVAHGFSAAFARAAIVKAARTGKIGDGKIFVTTGMGNRSGRLPAARGEGIRQKSWTVAGIRSI